MKKCTNCAKDLPDAALHCVFCGSKQPPAAAPAAGAQAKTVMGWQATDLLKDIQAKGAQPAPGVQMPRPAGGPPPAAPMPPPAAPPMGMAATLVPPSAGPGPMGGGQPQMPPAAPPPSHESAQAKTMMVQGPPLGHGPGAMGGMGGGQMPPAAPPPAAPPPHSPASQAATMFVQGPALGGPTQGGPMQGGPMQGGPMQGGPMQGGPMQGGPMQGGGYGGPPPPMGGPPGGGYGGPPPQQMGGYPPPQQGGYPPPQQGGYPPPQQGGPPGYNPQPMGGYNPQPVGGGYQQPGGPMNPPYLASRTAARVGAPVEPYKDGIKIVLIAFGLALLVAGAMPFTIEPSVTFRWDALSAEGTPALMKFQLIYVSAAAILALVFGLVPLATVPRGAMTAVLGLVPLVLALVTYLKDAKEIQWQILVLFVGALTLVPGLLLRSEYRSQMLPRILATIGAICVIVTYVVPSGGGDPPIVGAFEMIGEAPGKAKVMAILALLPFGLAVASLLVWIPPPSSAGAKVIAWLIIVTGVIVAYTGMLIAGNIGDAVKARPNDLLMSGWVAAAWSAFIGYGIATILGKNLEHS